jgi:hypothetical protein
MPRADTLERFIAQVEANDHVGAVEAFYAEHVSMRENFEPARHGRDVAVANERRVLARAQSIESTCVRPVLVNGDHVVVRWIFRFVWHDGSVTRMEELAWQRWETHEGSERIVEEQFFYDPAQRVPVKPGG